MDQNDKQRFKLELAEYYYLECEEQVGGGHHSPKL